VGDHPQLAEGESKMLEVLYADKIEEIKNGLRIDTRGTFPHVIGSSFEIERNEWGEVFLMYDVDNGRTVERKGFLLGEQES
jgi:hypothetical protein